MPRDLFSKRTIILVLLVLGFGIHGAWLGTPNSAVFDEVHFGKFISAYFTHEYYFDIHPPLGKLIIAGWGWLWGYQPGFSFANIGETYPDNLYIALRLLPSLAGALLPLVVFGVARRLRMSLPAAALAGVLVALDNALLVQSRHILLDAFLLLFGFTSIYCYLRWRDGGSKWLLVAAGVLGGMTMSIKWTGITFLGLIVLMELIDLYRNRHELLRHRIGLALASIAVLPLIVYASIFTIHFALLTKSGAGDAFMSARFQRSLQGNLHAENSTLAPLTMPEKIIELNREMYRSNQRLTATHPYASAWYTWPFLDRPIFYWVNNTARVYLLGNPAVWWLSTAAVMIVFINLLLSGLRTIQPVPALLMGAWLINMLPFMGIHRVMFLYHYFAALIWAILMLALVVDQSPKTKQTVITLSALAVAMFIFFAPLSYGLPLSETAYSARVWFASWR
jgi:dolichyl-phosphate-mannose-protein mannosyltransferase